MINRLGKLLLVLGVLGILLAGVLYLFRTSLAAYGLTLLLEREGARQVSVVVTQVAGDRVEISDLAFILPRGARLLDLELENLQVEYVATELRHGRLRDITLERLSLRQTIASEQATPPPSSAFGLPELLHLLSDDLQNRIPFHSAKVATIHLAGPDLPPALTAPLALAVTRTDSSLKVDCRPVSPDSPAAVGLVLKTDGGALSLRATAAEAGELSATLAGEQLHGSFALDPAQLNSLLVLFGRNAVQLFDHFGTTQMSGGFQADLGHWPQFDVQAQLVAESLTLAETRLKGFALDFSLEAVDAGNVEHPFQAIRFRVVSDQLSRSTAVLSNIDCRIGLRTAADSGYDLSEGSALRIGSFKSAEFSLQEAVFPLGGHLNLADGQRLQAQLIAERPWSLTKLSSDALSIEKATLRPALDLTLRSGGGRIALLPGFHIDLEQLTAGDMRIPALSLSPSTTAQLDVGASAELSWELKNSRWQITLPLVNIPRAQVQTKGITLSLAQINTNDRATTLTGRAETERLTLGSDAKTTCLHHLAADFTLTPKGVTAKGAFHIGPFNQALSFALDHEFATARGGFRLNTPDPLPLSEEAALSSLLEPWPFPGDIVKGRIDLTCNADWTPQSDPTIVADIRLEEIGGHWQKIEFAGLSLSHRIRLWPTLESLNLAQVSVGLLAASVPVTDIRATLQLRRPEQEQDQPLTVELKRGHFTLLGNSFSVTPFTYRSSAEKNHIHISTSGLDLAQLQPLIKTEGLKLAGKVDATLPLELGADGITIVDGSIRQNGPGVINYRPQDRGMLKRAGMPEIAVKALENFHYHLLGVEMSYRPDGQLLLAVQLQGKSPTAGTERPFHINLNVEQNLLSLLKSLRYSEFFDRRIEEYMKKKR